MADAIEVAVRERASEWARAKLASEAAEKAGADDPGLRQITVRIPAGDLAFIDAVAKRFGVSRNQAICLFVASGCGDAYEALPHEDRVALLASLSETLGRRI